MLKVTDLLTMMANATQADLDEIETELEQTNQKADALRSLQKIIANRVHGAPPPKARGPNKKPKEPTNGAAAVGAEPENISDERRRKVAKYLLQVGNKPTQTSILANKCDAPLAGFHWVLRSPWFKVAGEFVCLSEDGKAAAAKLP